MSLTLGTIITAARDRSPWFHRSRCTDAVVARYLSDLQNELIGTAVRRDPQYVAQVANVIISLSGNDAPGTVGAGTVGGTPGTTDSDGIFSTQEQTAGALIEAKLTSAEGASVFVADRVVTSAVSTTLTSTGANRTVNQDAQRVLVITAGTGIGQRRTILSNTADTWTISTGSDGQTWATVPDTTSLFDVVEPNYDSDDAATVFTALPATTTTTGYLVRLDAHGIPFIDFTQPLVATMDLGVSLPAMQFPLDATVWFVDGSSCALPIVTAERRFGVAGHAIYFVGQQLFLAGCQQEWADVQSVAVRYTPIAPPFTALTDTFLIPDHARPALVSKAASFMAMRVAGMPDVQIDPSPHSAEGQRAELLFLASVSAAKRGRGLRTREVW